MFLAAGFHRLQRRHVLGHRHHLRAGQLFDHRIAFLVVAVRVAAEQDLGVGELESELLDGLLNRRHVPLIRAVDEDVALRRDDEKGGQALGPDVIDVSDDLVGWELRRLIVGRADVALEQRLLRERVAADGTVGPGP